MSKKDDDDNRSNQLNPNNDAYRSSRGYGGSDDDDDDYVPISVAEPKAWRPITDDRPSEPEEVFVFPAPPEVLSVEFATQTAAGQISVEGPSRHEILENLRRLWDASTSVLYLRAAFGREVLFLEERVPSTASALRNVALARSRHDGTFPNDGFSIHPFSFSEDRCDLNQLAQRIEASRCAS